MWWIDDDPRRKKAKNSLEEKSDRFNIEFESPENIDEMNTEPDLALVDWKLNTDGYSGKGLSMEAKIREMYPEVPIYGFSGEPDEAKDLSMTTERFDQGVFSFSTITGDKGFVDSIISDIEDYKTVSQARGEELDALYSALAVPKNDQKRVKSVIPREFSDGIRDGEESPLNFSQWVLDRFLETPGPLLDETWAATTLGIRPEAFEDYWDKLLSSSDVEDVEYSGVFSHQADFFIWESQMVEVLVSLLSESKAAEMAQETCRMGANILDVAEEDISRCKVCDEKFPGTVAAAGEGESAKYPVHYHCSDVHHSREGSFKDYRVIDNG
jgi:hypothetical protein